LSVTERPLIAQLHEGARRMTNITTFFMFDVPPKRGHTDKAARRLCPTSLLRNVRSADVLVGDSCRDAFQAWPLDDAGGHRVVRRLAAVQQDQRLRSASADRSRLCST
jgi:hypothetical protein